jgi:hypothetical protein
MDRMSPPEGCHLYREQIGAFVLGKLDGWELEDMRTHLNGCSACLAEVRELEHVVAALADADPDRIEEYPRPPGDLEDSTFAPISGELLSARRRRGRRFGWSGLAAAAIFAVVIGLAGLTWFLEPAVAMEPLAFTRASGVKPEGHLIAHASGTEIRLVVSGLRDGQTYRVTLISEDGKRVDAGTFIGAGEKQVRGTFTAALLRKDADRLEVRTPGGKMEFFSKLPEKPRDKVRDWPLFGILPWAEPHLHNKTMGSGGPEGKGGANAEDKPPADTQEKPKAPGPGGGTPPPEKSRPEGGKSLPPRGGGKPGAGPEGSEPGGGLHKKRHQVAGGPDEAGGAGGSGGGGTPCTLPPTQQPPTCRQYDPQS